MNKIFYFFILICISYSFSAYSQSLPLVTNAGIWYCSEQDSTSLSQNTRSSNNNSQKSASSQESQDSAVLLNFHSVKSFKDEVSSLRMPYDISRSSRLTVIVVFHSQDTIVEHGIWSVFRGGKQISGLTDKRLLRQNSEYIYGVKRRGIPLINTSMQSFSKLRGSTDNNHFELGNAILRDSTVSFFFGDIAECLVFDHFLKKQQALKVETYLAIKYGITLIESDYLSSSDVVLWSYEENKEYSNCIAGIGQDSVFGLLQRQGSSTEDADLLTISVGKLSLRNNANDNFLGEKNYLVWGHNNGEMVYDVENSCESSYPMLGRKWLIQATYSVKKTFSTMLKFRIPEEYIDSTRLCYLTIDRSGSGDFSSKQVEYIVQDSIDELGNVYFSDVIWDKDGSGKDVFSFSYGAVLETEAKLSCPNVPSGSLLVKLCGGKTPFEYILENDSTHQQFSYYGDREYMFEELGVGIYTLSITDANNNVNINKIEIKSYSMEEALINGCDSLLEIVEKSSVIRDNEKHINKKELKGEDVLENDRYYKLYPNPSAGHYSVEADFPFQTDIIVRVYTISGSFIKEFRADGKRHYIFEDYISTQGSYLIKIETIYGIKEFKLTVIR